MEHAAVAIGTTADLEEMKVRRWREERPEQSLQSVHAPDTRSRGQRDLLAHIQRGRPGPSSYHGNNNQQQQQYNIYPYP